MTNDTTAPERIWANLNVSPVGVVLQGTLTIEPSEIVAQVEYVRADLPAAVTVKQIEDALRDYKQLDELLCCSGFDIYGQVGCGCQGVTLREEIAHRILSALTPAPVAGWRDMVVKFLTSGDKITLLEVLERGACKDCGGSGEKTDASPGDISFNTWVCQSCQGTGWNKQAVAEIVEAVDLFPAPGEPATEQPDDVAVNRFAEAMKAKMAAAREKGRSGWDDPEQCSLEFLASLLIGHVRKGNAGNFEDIANLCMMLHQRGADPSILAATEQQSVKEAARVLLEAMPNPIFDRLKYPLSGEFKWSREVFDENGDEVTEQLVVPWVVIKEILDTALRSLAQGDE